MIDTIPGRSGVIRKSIYALTVSAAAVVAWYASEGFTDHAVIPTTGDVPTIGHGSTRYEDGSRVKMGDTITRKRADQLARNLMSSDERALRRSLPSDATMTQGEWDAYSNFIGQFGIGNWNGSTSRRLFLAGDYRGACNALLRYKFSAGYDCSTLVNGLPNKRCYGVWTRQQERVKTCLSEL